MTTLELTGQVTVSIRHVVWLSLASCNVRYGEDEATGGLWIRMRPYKRMIWVGLG